MTASLLIPSLVTSLFFSLIVWACLAASGSFEACVCSSFPNEHPENKIEAVKVVLNIRLVIFAMAFFLSISNLIHLLLYLLLPFTPIIPPCWQNHKITFCLKSSRNTISSSKKLYILAVVFFFPGVIFTVK